MPASTCEVQQEVELLSSLFENARGSYNRHLRQMVPVLTEEYLRSQGKRECVVTSRDVLGFWSLPLATNKSVTSVWDRMMERKDPAAVVVVKKVVPVQNNHSGRIVKFYKLRIRGEL